MGKSISQFHNFTIKTIKRNKFTNTHSPGSSLRIVSWCSRSPAPRLVPPVPLAGTAMTHSHSALRSVERTRGRRSPRACLKEYHQLNKKQSTVNQQCFTVRVDTKLPIQAKIQIFTTRRQKHTPASFLSFSKAWVRMPLASSTMLSLLLYCSTATLSLQKRKRIEKAKNKRLTAGAKVGLLQSTHKVEV